MSKVLADTWKQIAPNLYKGQLDALPPKNKRKFTYRNKTLPLDSRLLTKVAQGATNIPDGSSLIAVEGNVPYVYVYALQTEPPDANLWTITEDPSMTVGNLTDWVASDGWSNGSPFNVGWLGDAVDITNGTITLTLKNTPASGKPYASGEYRTTNFYKYGRYSAWMKAAKGAGLITGFFSYTGEADGNPHDELDIVEIAGQNTTQLRTNYWTAGRKHESFYDLGFDASENFHLYEVEFSPTSITWFVDGNQVREATEDLPTNAGKIMINLWCGDASATWLGNFQYTEPVLAQFKDIKFIPALATPTSTPTPTPAPASAPIGQDVSGLNFDFSLGSDQYWLGGGTRRSIIPMTGVSGEFVFKNGGAYSSVYRTYALVAGKQYRLEIRTKVDDPTAGYTIYIDNEPNAPIALVPDSTDWKEYKITVPCPNGTISIRYEDTKGSNVAAYLDYVKVFELP